MRAARAATSASIARLIGLVLRVLGVVALTDCDHADQQRDHGQHDVAPTRIAVAACAAGSRTIAVAEREAGVDELRLAGGETLAAGEVDRGIEPQPTIEVGVAPSVFVPSFGRAAQFLAHEKFGPLFCDPGAEARPQRAAGPHARA